LITNQLLYQLSYTGVLLCRIGGLQPVLARVFTVIFHGALVKAKSTVKTWQKLGFKTWFAIHQAVTMHAYFPTAKRFGNRSTRLVFPSPRASKESG
jgi:hypothetical protein